MSTWLRNRTNLKRRLFGSAFCLAATQSLFGERRWKPLIVRKRVTLAMTTWQKSFDERIGWTTISELQSFRKLTEMSLAVLHCALITKDMVPLTVLPRQCRSQDAKKVAQWVLLDEFATQCWHYGCPCGTPFCPESRCSWLGSMSDWGWLLPLSLCSFPLRPAVRSYQAREQNNFHTSATLQTFADRFLRICRRVRNTSLMQVYGLPRLDF